MPRQVNFRVADDERDLIRFLDERQTNPLRRGDLTHDIKYCIRFTMAYLKKNESDLTRCDRLINISMDKMNDVDNAWTINHRDRLSKKIDNSANAIRRWRRFKPSEEQTTNL